MQSRRLEKRMENRGFTPDDRLLQLVRSAHDILHRVSVELHYRACESAREKE